MDESPSRVGVVGKARQMRPPATLDLWPAGWMDLEAYSAAWPKIESRFRQRLHAHGIETEQTEHLAGIYLPLAAWVQRQCPADGAPLMVGINGAQGSGKSTLSDFLALALSEIHGRRVASLSLDDLYRTRAERQALARDIHPLLATRGVPGTHDTALGLAVIAALRAAQADDETAIPSFDKARDDRRPLAEWPRFRGRPDIIVLEGWCVGTRPQSPQDLELPVNTLEAQEDRDGRWRRYVNNQLAGSYAELFAQLDRLVFLRVPDMTSVFEWRHLQEQKLRAKSAGEAGPGLLDDDGIRRFIQYFERLTRHNLEDLPDRADITLDLDRAHRFIAVRFARNPYRVRANPM